VELDEREKQVSKGVVEVEKKSSEVEAREESCEARALELTSAYERLGEKVSEIERQASELDERERQIEEQVLHNKENAADVEGRARTFEEQASEIEGKASMLTVWEANIQDQAKDVERKASEIEKKRSDLEDELQKVNEQVEQNKAFSLELDGKAVKIQELEQMLTDREMRLQEQASQIENQALDVERRSLELEGREQEYIKVQAFEIENKTSELEDREQKANQQALDMERKLVEIDSLRREHADQALLIKEQASDIEQKTAALETSIQALAEQEEKVREQTLQIEEQAAEIGRKISEVEELESSIDRNSAETTAKLEEANQRISELLGTNKNLEEIYQKLEDETKAKLEDADKRISSITKDRTSSEEMRQQVEQDTSLKLEEAERRIVSITKESKTSEEMHQQFQQDAKLKLEDAMERVSIAMSENKTLEEKHQQLERDANAKLEEAEKRICTLTQQNKLLEEMQLQREEQAEQKLAQESETAQGLAEQLEAARALLLGQERRAEDAAATALRLGQELEEQRARCQHLEGEDEERGAQVEELAAKLEAAEAAGSAVREQLAAAVVRLDEELAERVRQGARAEVLEEQLEKLRQDTTEKTAQDRAILVVQRWSHILDGAGRARRSSEVGAGLEIAWKQRLQRQAIATRFATWALQLAELKTKQRMRVALCGVRRSLSEQAARVKDDMEARLTEAAELSDAQLGELRAETEQLRVAAAFAGGARDEAEIAHKVACEEAAALIEAKNELEHQLEERQHAIEEGQIAIEEIALLKQEKESVAGTVAKLTAEVKSWQQMAQRLEREEVKRCQQAKDIATWERECEEFRAHSRELSLTVQQFKQDNEMLAVENKSLKDSVSFFESGLERVSGQHAELMGHVNNKQKIRYTVKLKDECGELRAELNKARKKIAKLEISQKTEALFDALFSLGYGSSMEHHGPGRAPPGTPLRSPVKAGATPLMTPRSQPPRTPCSVGRNMPAVPALPGSARGARATPCREATGHAHADEAVRRCKMQERTLERVSMDFQHMLALVERAVLGHESGSRGEKASFPDLLQLLRRMAETPTALPPAAEAATPGGDNKPAAYVEDKPPSTPRTQLRSPLDAGTGASPLASCQEDAIAFGDMPFGLPSLGDEAEVA